MDDYLNMVKNKIMDPSDLDLSSTGLYTFLNPYTYLRHRQSSGRLAAFDGVFIDGILLVSLLRWFRVKRVGRASFDMTSLAPQVFEQAAAGGRGVFLIGGPAGTIERAVANIRGEYPRLNIVGYRNGFFDEGRDREETLDKILRLAPDITVVGMGAPLQEQFLLDLRARGWIGMGFTCGAFFEQAARDVQYYPRLVDRLQLRWLYRILKEEGKLERFVRSYPRSVWAFMQDVRRHRR